MTRRYYKLAYFTCIFSLLTSSASTMFKSVLSTLTQTYTIYPAWFYTDFVDKFQMCIGDTQFMSSNVNS